MSRHRYLLTIPLLCAATLAGCGGKTETTTTGGAVPGGGEACAAANGVPEKDGKPKVEMPAAVPTSLQSNDLTPGNGAEVKASSMVTVHYVGLSCKTGKQFDSSWDRGQPISFSLGQVIQGWQQGMIGMKVGGRRQLAIPSDLAYGAAGKPPIGPNEALVFVIDLVGVK